MKHDIALVYMAGGISSRFGGRIKSLISVGPNRERLLECSMLQALPAGFTKIVLIVSPTTAEPLRAVFGNSFRGVPVIYALQEFDKETRDKPWGTVDALCSARSMLDCPFVVCNGDDLYGTSAFELLVQHLRVQKDAAIVGYRLRDVISETPNNRAILEVDEAKNVQKIVETFGITRTNLAEKKLCQGLRTKVGSVLESLSTVENHHLLPTKVWRFHEAGGFSKSEEEYCSMNILALFPPILDLLYRRFQAFKETHNGDRKSECILPNELSALLKARAFSMKLYPAQEQWIGVTAPEDEEKVRTFLANK